ncbi:MAG TPA: type II toxin-antitoxin system HicA family toxin [Rhodocyclaceae bacterium]|nr:type II toxin-antitoxin system HicA family toxin [Rhodocyclaceae bacterium]
MNARTKLLQSLRNNPRDRRIEDLLSLARHFGIECRNHGGSHHVFSAEGVEQDVTVPAHRPIKPVYVRQFLALIECVLEVRK